MQKIPTVYERTEDRKFVVPDRSHISPGCDWVLLGEGTPTRKWNGTCVMLDQFGLWWARRDVKPGGTEPERFFLVHEDVVTGNKTGYEPIENSGFAKLHAEAVANNTVWEPGTYELIGPKINGNLDQVESHVLMEHASAPSLPMYYDEPIDVVAYAATLGWEGIVWHHPSGRMAKLKVRDIPPTASA